MPSTISAGTTAGTAIAVAGDTTGNLAFQTNGTTTAMTIDTSQNVGIGTTSPTARLGLPVPEFTSSVTNGMVRFQNPNVSADGCIQSYYVSGAGTDIYIGANSYIDTGGSTARFSNSYATSAINIRRDGSINFLTNTSGGNATNRMTLTSDGLLQFNSGYGSVATAYGVRAWVNFNGSNGSINGSGGVSSVTRNGTGDYTVAYSFTFPSNTYTLWGMGRRNSSAQRPVLLCMNNSFYENTTTGARFYTMLNDSATIEDPIQFWFGAIR